MSLEGEFLRNKCVHARSTAHRDRPQQVVGVGGTVGQKTLLGQGVAVAVSMRLVGTFLWDRGTFCMGVMSAFFFICQDFLGFSIKGGI
jgi:hypothetical protein